MPDQSRELLRRARVHIAATGRVGTAIALGLHTAGAGVISANDHQRFEQEQLETCVFSRTSDLGRFKVHVLERFFDGRPGSVFLPVVGRNEARSVWPYLEQADLIISCANSFPARLFIEQAAVNLRKPCVQACVQDGRTALGGVVTLWAPEANCS